MLIFAIVFLALAFTVIGLVTSWKIFSLFSAGVFLVLLIELQTYTAVVVVLVGFIIFQVCYALVGIF